MEKNVIIEIKKNPIIKIETIIKMENIKALSYSFGKDEENNFGYLKEILQENTKESGESRITSIEDTDTEKKVNERLIKYEYDLKKEEATIIFLLLKGEFKNYKEENITFSSSTTEEIKYTML
jgi:hypothetical protein